MIEITRIRSNPDEIIEGLKKRHFDAHTIVDKIVSIDEKCRNNKTKLGTISSEINLLSKRIGTFIREGNGEKAEKEKINVAELKIQESTLKQQIDELELELQQHLYQLPNVPHSLVRTGKDAQDNEEIFLWGTFPNYSFEPLAHWDLAKKYYLIDFELGAKVSGAGFPFYIDKGAKLQRALISFFLSEAEKAGYTEYLSPIVVNEQSGYGTGQLPDKEGQMYHATADNLYLIPTAEVPLTNIYRDHLFSSENFSVKMTGYTPCFRREAGSYGKDVRGLNRLHQFDKVEIVRIEHPKNSEQALAEMNEHVKGLLQKLELPFRILRLCGGDMGFAASMTYDFEVYSAAQQKWLEVSSVSRFDTYQANRLKLRFKTSDKKTQLAHTLNGSALALPRIVAALLENYQDTDCIHIPKVLVPYTGFNRIEKKEK